MMGFPSEKQLKKMREKLEQAEGFLMLSPDAKEIDKFRFDICQKLLKYSFKKSLNSSDMADFLEISKADMSRIFNHRIEKFSTDKLIKLYEKINPEYKLKVSWGRSLGLIEI